MGGKQTKIKKRRSKSKKLITTELDISEKEDHKQKIVLLGPGKSGKTSIAKLMRHFVEDGMTEEDRLKYKESIYSALIRPMQIILPAMDILKISFETEERLADAKLILEWDNFALFVTDTSKLLTAAKNLVGDSGFKACLEQFHGLPDKESFEYFAGRIDKIADCDYIPTLEDILHIDTTTTGIYENNYSYEGLEFTFVETAGMRSERKKWIHAFEDVDIVLFCASVSDYNQVLLEDEQTNRMRESLKLFQGLYNNQMLKNSVFVLLLNKKDLLKEKVEKCHIGETFDEFKGDNTYENVCEFIKEMFENIIIGEDNREVYIYFTCATDPDDFRPIFEELYRLMDEKTPSRHYLS